MEDGVESDSSEFNFDESEALDKVSEAEDMIMKD